MKGSVEENGRRLLEAIERMIDSPDGVIERVDELRREVGPGVEALSARVIQHYGTRSALVGGATALPAMLPGVGGLVVALGSSLADMARVLKLEVEMCMALATAHGHDIRDRSERQHAYLLAAVGTYELHLGGDVLRELGEASRAAIWSYGPRELGKLVLAAFGKLALSWASRYAKRSLVKAVPLLGVGISASMNRTLTRKVGHRAHRELLLRGRAG